MPKTSPFKVELTPLERRVLEKMASAYTDPYYSVIRARLILLAGDGMANKDIAAKLDLPIYVVSKWRKRYVLEGLDGLKDRPRSGRPRGDTGSRD